MTLGSLHTLVQHATQPGRWYRHLYGMDASAPPLTIDSWDAWRDIPFLKKEDLLASPLQERIFVPMDLVDHITSTSGTTGSLPLFSARTRLSEYEFRVVLDTGWHAALSSKLVPHQQERYLAKRSRAPRVIVIDPRNTKATARLAKAAGVDAIFAFLFHMPLITEQLVHAGVAPHIRYIEVAGETCSESQFREMQRAFPNARIVSTYGLSEVENSPVGIPCKPLSIEDTAQVHHAKDGCYLELLDTESNRIIEPTTGAIGELLITCFRGGPAAFPMIRYRSGDTVRVVEEHCARHGTWSFVIMGRADVDFVRIPGGMLRADEIERTLRSLGTRVSDTFEMEVGDVSDGGVTKTSATLRIDADIAGDEVALARDIAAVLRVGPASTYADGVARGLYAPLICERLPHDLSAAVRKRRRIIRS